MPIMTFDASRHAPGLRWLYVDFNSYFASVEQQLQPHLRNRPIIVVPVETDSTCAIAASYEAKAFGIRTGTPVHEAKRLCPGLACVLGRHEYYIDFHHRIQEEIEKHIHIDTVASIDEVACRLMDNETSEEAVIEIAFAIKRGLAKHIGEYVRCSIGIAPNRYLAKIATDLQKPDGLVVLRGEELPGRLLSLTLRDLPGIGHNMEQRLRRKGIYDMPGLWKLDAKAMRRAWGSVWGEKMWHYLRGAELEDEPTTRRSIGHSHVLAPELRNSKEAKLVARRLTLKVASRLRRMEYYAGGFHLSVRLENGNRVEAATQCYRAQDTITFLRLMEKSWKQIMANAEGKRMRKVSITLHNLRTASELQPELLPGISDEELRIRPKWEKMSQALDKINHRYGRDTIVVGMTPEQGKGFTGTKIAFTRIPDKEEFLE